MQNQLDTVAGLMRRAERILFITGAGLSADSGLPTYRGLGGLYENKATEDHIPIEDAISGAMLNVRPELTWKYLLQMEQTCRHAHYNRGHEIIALLEQDKPGTWVLTQNIDGFHHAAGSKHLIEIHGRFSDLRCMSCAYHATVKDYSGLERIPPRCPRCGGVVRPGVVLFGEMLPEAEIMTLYRQIFLGFDLVFSIGTTSVFPYISRPVISAREKGKPTVEINPGVTSVSDIVDYKFTGGAAETLAQLWQRYQSGMAGKNA
jgi:NAD-dependent deacetylase